MSTTTDTIEWLRPFHEAAAGRTSDALDLALGDWPEAPPTVQSFVIREGLRLGFHALHRRSGIRVNGDADTMPLFVATVDEDGTVIHQVRPLLTVADIDTQITYWGNRRAQANRELSWWTHQHDLAERAVATPTERLRDVWDRLGVAYEVFVGEASS